MLMQVHHVAGDMTAQETHVALMWHVGVPSEADQGASIIFGVLRVRLTCAVLAASIAYCVLGVSASAHERASLAQLTVTTGMYVCVPVGLGVGFVGGLICGGEWRK